MDLIIEKIKKEIVNIEEKINKIIVEINNCLINNYNTKLYKKFLSFIIMSLVIFIFASDLKNILNFLPVNIIPTAIVSIDLLGSILFNKIVFERKNDSKIDFVQNIKKYIILRSEQAKIVSKKIVDEMVMKELNNNFNQIEKENTVENNLENEIYQLENLNNKDIEKKSIDSSCNKIIKEADNSNKYFLATTIVSLAIGNVAFLSENIVPNLLGIIAPAILCNVICAKDILKLRNYTNEALKEIRNENPNLNNKYSEEEILSRENKISKLKANLIINRYILENIIEEKDKELKVANNLNVENELKLIRKK